LPVNRRDVGRGRRDRNSQVSLDQVLAECRRMGGAAAATGQNNLRRMVTEPRDQFLQRPRSSILPPHRFGCLFKLRRHAGIGFDHFVVSRMV
jgi:hypothetical protein